ncbi:MAG TPA: PEP-CTERM sorting domain-containing protein [Gemmataceae bacterium]|nr:PEP-CTERM sorting domain-containing protein [Gemmataceae bacterium]
MLQMILRKCIAVGLLGVLGLTASLARADYIAVVSMDTTPFESLPSNDVITIAMSFTDGSNGDGVEDNKVTITNFNVDGGTLDASSTSTTGAVSITPAGGDLTGTVILIDSSSLNSITENFTPGSSLSFQLDQTTNLSYSEEYGPAPYGPDSFNFTIYDSLGLINYDSPSASFLDVFSDIYLGPVTVGGSITNGPPISNPTFTPLASAPEPSTLVLMLSGAVLAGAASARRRYRGRKRSGEEEHS